MSSKWASPIPTILINNLSFRLRLPSKSKLFLTSVGNVHTALKAIAIEIYCRS